MQHNSGDFVADFGNIKCKKWSVNKYFFFSEMFFLNWFMPKFDFPLHNSITLYAL